MTAPRGLLANLREIREGAQPVTSQQEQNELFHDVLVKLANLPAQLRQAMADQLWSSIPFTVNEWAWSNALAIGQPLQAAPQTGGLELITSIVVSVPTGATGVVQLGLNQLPVPAGVTVIAPIALPLGSGDTRQLTLAGGAGAAALILSGTQQPTYGAVAR